MTSTGFELGDRVTRARGSRGTIEKAIPDLLRVVVRADTEVLVVHVQDSGRVDQGTLRRDRSLDGVHLSDNVSNRIITWLLHCAIAPTCARAALDNLACEQEGLRDVQRSPSHKNKARRGSAAESKPMQPRLRLFLLKKGRSKVADHAAKNLRIST